MLHSSNYARRARKKNIWWKTRFRCYLCLTAQRTGNQDGLLRDPTASKVTHYPQITKFPSPMSECALLCLEHCSVVFSLSCSALIKSGYTSRKENTRKTVRFRCYLKRCVHRIWSYEWMLSDRTVCKCMHYAHAGKKVFLTEKFQFSRTSTTQSRVL